MRDHILACLPEEGCGLLLSNSEGKIGRHFPIENILHSSSRYQLHPQQMVKVLLGMEQGGNRQLIIYHSHPSGPPNLSQTDLVESYYPDALYLLWFTQDHRWKTKLFSIFEGTPKEIVLTIT